MESMEYDSDNEPDIPPPDSPMQHSGWEPCRQVVSYVSTMNVFQRSPNQQGIKSQHLGSTESMNTTYPNSGFQTPKSEWTTCRNVISAVSAFSGFRSVGDTLSPQDGEKSLANSEGEDSCELNSKMSLFKASSPNEEKPMQIGYGGHQQSGPLPSSGIVSKAGVLFSGKKIQQTNGVVSQKSDQYSQPEKENDGPGNGFVSEHINGTKTLPGNRKLCKRYSLQTLSPSRSSPKRHSLDPSFVRSSRRTCLPPAKLSKLSEEAETSSHSSYLRPLCKPAPAKKRKIVSSQTIETTSDSSAPRSKFFTFQSFLVLSVVISICLSVYTFRLLESRCSSFANLDADQLTKELNSKVYGQHIATKLIPHLLGNYLKQVRDGDSSKPLVMSLHGWTGVGKNYISKIVSDYFPYATVNKLLVPLHFAHEASDDVYAQQIPEWIKTNLTQCHINFVIFDEMDKASNGVIKGLDDSVNSITEMNATNTPVVFLLLSNSKGAEINKLVFQLESNGRQRGSISHNEIIPVFGTGKPLWYTKLTSGKTIDAFVPFLPLEKGHILQCIKKDLVLKGLDVEKRLVTDVVQEMSFFKLNSGKEFSHTGCKRVSDKVNLIYNKFAAE